MKVHGQPGVHGVLALEAKQLEVGAILGELCHALAQILSPDRAALTLPLPSPIRNAIQAALALVGQGQMY